MTKDMDAETLAALKASIAKWEKNARVRRAEGAKTGPKDCPLCDLFYWHEGCAGCPVSQRSGQRTCNGTPYERACDAIMAWRFGEGTGEAFRAAAREEVVFLKSLLPEAEQ